MNELIVNSYEWRSDPVCSMTTTLTESFHIFDDFFFFFVIVGVDGEDCHGRMLERIIAWSISKISSNLGVDDEGERMIDFN